MRRRVIVAIGAGVAVLFGLGLLANRPHGDQWRVGTMQLLAHRIEVFHSQNGRLPRDLGELRAWATRTGRSEFGHDIVDREGRDFLYAPDANGVGFALVALGEDGQPGGWFANADRRLEFKGCPSDHDRPRFRLRC